MAFAARSSGVKEHEGGEGEPAQDRRGLLVGVLNHARAPLVGSVDLRAAPDRRAGQGGQQGVE